MSKLTIDAYLLRTVKAEADNIKENNFGKKKELLRIKTK